MEKEKKFSDIIQVVEASEPKIISLCILRIAYNSSFVFWLSWWNPWKATIREAWNHKFLDSIVYWQNKTKLLHDRYLYVKNKNKKVETYEIFNWKCPN